MLKSSIRFKLIKQLVDLGIHPADVQDLTVAELRHNVKAEYGERFKILKNGNKMMLKRNERTRILSRLRRRGYKKKEIKKAPLEELRYYADLPAAQKRAAKQPVARKNVAKAPVVKKAVIKKTARKNVAKEPIAKEPIVKKNVVKEPKPVARKNVGKEPVAMTKPDSPKVVAKPTSPPKAVAKPSPVAKLTSLPEPVANPSPKLITKPSKPPTNTAKKIISPNRSLSTPRLTLLGQSPAQLREVYDNSLGKGHFSNYQYVIDADLLPRRTNDTLRIMTYNVQEFRDRLSLDNIGYIGADIVLLQEATDRSYFKEFAQHGYQKFYSEAAYSFGNMLLSKQLKILEPHSSIELLPRYQEKRIAVRIKLELARGVPLWVINTHLDVFDTSGKTRAAQANYLLDAWIKPICSRGEDVLLAGDMNEVWIPELSKRRQRDVTTALEQVYNYPLSTQALANFREHLKDVFEVTNTPPPSFTVWNLTRVDHVFVTPKFAERITRVQAVRIKGSDHLPIILDWKKYNTEKIHARDDMGKQLHAPNNVQNNVHCDYKPNVTSLEGYCNPREEAVRLALGIKTTDPIRKDTLITMYNSFIPDKKCITEQWLFIQRNALLSKMVDRFKGSRFKTQHFDMDKFKKKDGSYYQSALNILKNQSPYALKLGENGYPLLNDRPNKEAIQRADGTVSDMHERVESNLFNMFIQTAPRCVAKPVILFRGQDSNEPWNDGLPSRISRRVLSASHVDPDFFAKLYMFVYHLASDVPYLFIAPFEWEFLIPMGVEMKLTEQYAYTYEERVVTVIHVQVTQVRPKKTATSAPNKF